MAQTIRQPLGLSGLRLRGERRSTVRQQGQYLTDEESSMSVTIEVDCHAYAWHIADPHYPECGPDNLTRMAEQYGVLVKFLPDHQWADWAWWYEITGPPANIIALMEAEYGDVPFDLEPSFCAECGMTHRNSEPC